MCTVVLRWAPDAPWPVLLGAIRDEFADRPWDPPARHWDGPWAGLLGGRDRQAGGTWLAVDPTPGRPGVAALLNAGRRDPLEHGARPTRGTLALGVLVEGEPPNAEALRDYDRFHLLLATLDRVALWSWDGEALLGVDLTVGDHIVVNLGLDSAEDPLVGHFAPLVASTAQVDPRPGLDTSAAWGPWVDLLTGDGLDPEDDRALLVHKEIEGRTYASTSATLVGLSPDAVRYDFTGTPATPSWSEVQLA
jgi:hypothetical protein